MLKQRGMEAVLAQRLFKALKKVCIEDVALDDPSRANHVVLGKPTVERRDEIVISIMFQNPLGTGKDTERLLQGYPYDESLRPYQFPGGETFGGAVFDTVIGVVWVAIRKMKDYNLAIEIISSVAERVRWAINQYPGLDAACDDYGNHLFRLETFRGAGYETGGRNVAINHRFIDFRGLIARTNRRNRTTIGGK